MAFSKTILLVVFAVLLISAAVSARRDRDLMAYGRPWRPDGRGGYNRGGEGGGGKGGSEAVDAGNGGGKGGNGGGKGGNGGEGGNGGRGGHGPKTEN